MCTLVVLALIVGAVALCVYAASRVDAFDRDLTDAARDGLDRTRYRIRPRTEIRP
jgi:hypothetical protein